MVRAADGGTEFVGEEVKEYAREEFVALEMEPGDAVVLHAAVVHMSEDNTSDRSRHAYSLHLVEGMEVYDERSWLQRGEDCEAGPFRSLDNPPKIALAT